MSGRRYFENEWRVQEQIEDVISGKGDDATIRDDIKSKFKSSLQSMLSDIEQASGSFEKHDISVYTGMTGYALLYLHLYEIFSDAKYLDKALSYVSSALKRLKHRRITFLCGDAGPLAVGAVVYRLCNKKDKSDDCIQQLLSMAESALPLDGETYDELLYGRAGYLYSLLFVNKYIGETTVPEKVINQVVDSMVESGRRQASRKSSAPALTYFWHGSEYIGAAHGYIGILFMMLHTDYQRHTDTIKSTLDFILGLQYSSGNFPSSFGSGNDRLIHWCHGAPGGVYLMILAYTIFGDEKYLTSAEKASDTVWERGLLKKGYGICHGAAGNGYGFLAMHKLTKDVKYLYRAAKFALWCCDYRLRQGLNTPDRPFSMFEGIAGAAYFLADVLQPDKAAFPAFEI